MSDYDRLKLKLEAMEFSGAPVAVLLDDAELGRILGVKSRKIFRASESQTDGAELISIEDLFQDEGPYRSLIIGVDKNKELTRAVVEWALKVLPRGGELVLIGEKRLGVASFEKLLNEKMEGIAKMPLKDLGRLSFWRKNEESETKTELWLKAKISVGFYDINLFALPGVFSRGELDEGTRLLIETIENKKLLPQSGRVLDLACGNGIVGAWVKKENAKLDITLTDDDANAIASAKKTFEENKIEAEGIFCADGIAALPEKIKYDLIALNPPFHSGQRVDYTLAQRLMTQAKEKLAYKGNLVIVANRFCPYEAILKELFGGFEALSENKGFKVLKASNK